MKNNARSFNISPLALFDIKSLPICRLLLFLFALFILFQILAIQLILTITILSLNLKL